MYLNLTASAQNTAQKSLSKNKSVHISQILTNTKHEIGFTFYSLYLSLLANVGTGHSTYPVISATIEHVFLCLPKSLVSEF